MVNEKFIPEIKRISQTELKALRKEGYTVFSSHNHTNFSDGTDYREMIDALVKSGVNLIALTDHQNMRVAEYAEAYIKEKYPEIGYLHAEEIDSVYGCVLSYGLQTEILVEIGDRLPISEIIENAHEQGALTVIAHPFHPTEGIFRTIGGLKKQKLLDYKFDGIEFFHADLPPFLNNLCSDLLALQPELFILGGDDAHFTSQIGRYFNLIGPNINIHDTDEILNALTQKNTSVIELSGWGARPFHMLPGFVKHFINKGLKRVNAFTGIYGLFKGIHFLHASMGWEPVEPQEFKALLQQVIQKMNINTVRLDAMGPETYDLVSVAKELGLYVILSPKYMYPEGFDKPDLDRSLTYEEYIDFCLDHAKRSQMADVDIFCIGNELTLELSDKKISHIKKYNEEFFMQYAPSSLDLTPRIGASKIAKISKIGKKKPNITTYLEKLCKKVRNHFNGIVSYASGSWEIRLVPWKFFDVVSANLYFSDIFMKYVEVIPGLKIKLPKGSPSVRAAHLFRQDVQYLKKLKKPVIISELGFQTVSNPIHVGPLPVQFLEDFEQFEYDEAAHAKAFSEVFELINEKIFVNGIVIHEWKDHVEKGFGLVRLDDTPKAACETISRFFKDWSL